MLIPLFAWGLGWQSSRLACNIEMILNGLKGELRNRFNLISEERVKFCEQNSENLMKIVEK